MASPVKGESYDEMTRCVGLFLGDLEEVVKEAGMAPIHDAAWEGDMEGLRRLVELSAVDVDAMNEHGWSPLSCASEHGHLDAVCYLLDHGAVVNLADEMGWTALMLACSEGHLEVVRLLLSRGADPSLRHQHGSTAVGYACLGISPGRAEIARLLIKTCRAGVNAQDDDGDTALHEACTRDHVEAARVLLLEGGADHVLTDHQGRTPMAMARERGHQGCVKLIQWFESELERVYVLGKMRQMEDDREAIKQAPTQAEARTAEEAQQAREEAAHEYMRGRVVRGEALPRVEVGVMPRRSKRNPGETMVVDAKVMGALLQHVVMDMKEDCFIVLMELMRLR